MEKNKKWTRVVWIIGIVALIIGSIDPLEGSVVIAAGSGLMALAAFYKDDRHWKIFLATFIMIVIGVVLLFAISSFGGFGGNSSLSWWWGLLIVPYPVGWLTNIILLIIRAVKKPAKTV
jgi:hypothetical protein